MQYKPYVEKFKIAYESIMEVLTTVSQALIGLLPAFFASNFLMEISGIRVLVGTFWAIVLGGLFAVILEILGFAILRKATSVFLSKYNGSIPSHLPILCGVVYVANMMLLTTLHGLLPESARPISIGLLCLMPVVGYISNGIQKAEDQARHIKEIADKELAEKQRIIDEQQRIDAENERQRQRQIEDEERAVRLEAERKRVESEIEIAKMRAEAAAQEKINRSINRSVNRTGVQSATEKERLNDENSNDQSQSTERRKALLLAYRDTPTLSMGDAAEMFGVSKSTIAGDIAWFTKSNIIHVAKAGKRQTITLNGGSEEFLAG